MMSNQSSVIQKIISKKLELTPAEAIHLKYLSRKGVLEELVSVELEANPYIATQKAEGPISPYKADFLVNLVAQNNPETFNSYNYAYEQILQQDSNSEKRGYEGLALLTQIRLMKYEYLELVNPNKPIDFPKFESYSFLHEKQVNYSLVLSNLYQVFKYFLQDIDIILTLNFYLGRLFQPEDLTCLDLLKKWLQKPANYLKEEGFIALHEAFLCCDSENINTVLNKNHPKYVESVTRMLRNLSADFLDSSLQYVNDIISKTIETTKTLEDDNKSTK